MAIAHATPGEVFDVRPLGGTLKDAKSTTLIRSAQLEVIRLVLPAGKQLPEHSVPGEITVQCVEGVIRFFVSGEPLTMQAGEMLLLGAGEPHALEALDDASVIVTIHLAHERK
ncbi:cupin domain-containing protein [Paraburkholderia tagetis]|uniref:Cupin domain-containing protein n=1 Tax=Paraburkholderia tagetis TaxID=2913261 RepID=A0A9X1RQE8_9BURK|nr:cupin domain-containing protein [Paraburkholderia tagetis]MCG5073428.1 cupin domain-containing protein [Paraburkholderia tagetis]